MENLNEFKSKVTDRLNMLESDKVLVPEFEKILDEYIELKGKETSYNSKQNAMNTEIQAATNKHNEQVSLARSKKMIFNQASWEDSLKTLIKDIKTKYK